MFDQKGHLTDHAIAALVSGEELPELTRLEIAEHLAYCDICLLRYSEAFAELPLLTPEVSCKKPLLRRIRERTVRLLTSRYAAAAAAVALALTLLWSDLPFPQSTMQNNTSLPQSAVSNPLDGWTERWSNALTSFVEGTQNIFDGLKGPGFGGNHR